MENINVYILEKLIIDKTIKSKSKVEYCSTIKELKKKYELNPQHEYPKRCNYTYDVTPEIEKIFVNLIDNDTISDKELTNFIQTEMDNNDLLVSVSFYEYYKSYQVKLSIKSSNTIVGGIEIYPLTKPDSGIEIYYSRQWESEKVPILKILCKLFDYIIESTNRKS